MNKDLPSILEKTVKKEMGSVGQAVIRSMSPAIEKIISSTIVETFQVCTLSSIFILSGN
jgi:enhancer of mRNA-decapping protein 4